MATCTATWSLPTSWLARIWKASWASSTSLTLAWPRSRIRCQICRSMTTPTRSLGQLFMPESMHTYLVPIIIKKMISSPWCTYYAISGQGRYLGRISKQPKLALKRWWNIRLKFRLSTSSKICLSNSPKLWTILRTSHRIPLLTINTLRAFSNRWHRIWNLRSTTVSIGSPSIRVRQSISLGEHNNWLLNPHSY